MSKLDSRDRDRGCRYGLKAMHRGASSLDGSVVLLDDAIQVTIGSDLYVTPQDGLATQQPQGASGRDVAVELTFRGPCP